jgi:hypothetical protein
MVSTTTNPQSPSQTTAAESSNKPGAAVSVTHVSLEGIVVGATVVLATIVGLALVYY